MAHFGKDLDSFSASRTVRILSSESLENYTVYLIEVTVGPYSWTVKHRYSDFHELHDKLVSTCKLDKNLLPPKKLFGNQSETFIKKRQGELEVYLQTVLYYLAHFNKYVSPHPPHAFFLHFNKYVKSHHAPYLVFFLHFNKYEIHGITQALAEELYNRGESILQSHEMFQMSPLQLHALTERLKLPEPTCESGDVKKDIGHILDFITRMKRLKICGSKEPVGSSNIDMNQLTFDLTLFKSLKYLEILNCSPKNIVGLETIKQTLKEFQLCRSTKTVREFLLQDIPHWRGEDGTLLVSYWEHVEEADMSHNFIVEIDDSVQLMPKVEHLDLSHNQLTTIQHLQWLSHLTFLDISHNNIHNLDSLHTKLGNLKTLKLAGNKLGSLQGFSKLFSLEILDVSNNEIGQVSDVKPIGGLPCLENLLLTGNPVTIVLDYRTKVLEVFGDRVNEVVLDNQKPNQKELDTVAVLQALQKARDNKDKVKRLTPKKTASSASLTDSEYSRTPPQTCWGKPEMAALPHPQVINRFKTWQHTSIIRIPTISELSSSSLTGPTHHRPISSPVTRTEEAGLTGSSITGPPHQRPISSPVTRAEQAELCSSALTGTAHHRESSSPGTRPEEADLHIGPPSRPEDIGNGNSPSADISSTSPLTRSAGMGISRYEEIDGLTTSEHQGPTLSPDMAQLNTVMAAADMKYLKKTAEYDIQQADNDSKTADSGNQPAANDSKTADSGNQPAANDSKTADSGKQPAANDSKTADSGKQPAANDSKTADSGNQAAANDSKTADSGNQPADNDSKTADSGNQPAANDSKTADSGNQAAANDSKIADSGNQAAANDSKTADSGNYSSPDLAAMLSALTTAWNQQQAAHSTGNAPPLGPSVTAPSPGVPPDPTSPAHSVVDSPEEKEASIGSCCLIRNCIRVFVAIRPKLEVAGPPVALLPDVLPSPTPKLGVGPQAVTRRNKGTTGNSLLQPSPFTTLQITKPITRFLHLHGVVFKSYIDDCIQAQRDPVVLLRQLEFSTKLLRQLERDLHINELEFLAVLLAIRHWATELRGSSLLIQTDNSSVVWYINHLGSTGSANLLQLAFRFFHLIDSLAIDAQARHIPGVRNVIADALSRSDWPSPTEWQLNPQIFRELVFPLSRPQVDLFATRFNHQLPQFGSPIPDQLAWDLDALVISWEALNAYAFPPPALLPRVIQKLRATRQILLILVVPYWPHLRSSKKLKGSTLATYLAAINLVLATTTGSKVSTVPELQYLLRSFKLANQSKKFRPPAWDLSVVLRHLASADYEPLAQKDFEKISFKTFFLVALATAARISELHALDVNRVQFERKKHGKVFLGLRWDFVAKNQLPGQPDHRRRLRKRLFIPLSSTSRAEVSRTTLSFWMRATILRAYTFAGLPPPTASNPHETRALASTMALHMQIFQPVQTQSSRSWLQKQLIGGGSPSRESTKENILDILWCNAVQYSNPTVFFSCCAVLTKSKIFIERLTDLDSGLPGVPDFEPFYILPMCNIQQIVLGCCLAYVKLEESFVGKMGTFILIGLDPSVLKTYVESVKLNCEGMKSLNAPDILDLSCDSDISRQIFNMEDKFGSSSDRIVYSCVVVAKPSHSRCLLVLSENRVYLIDIDSIYWPLPSFEAESEEMLQIGVMQNHPITDRISNISMYSAVNSVTTPKSQLRETNVRFAEFGLSMIFHETAGPKLFDVLFPSTSSRDFYLDRLTNLRAEHAHRMSPTLREEPEGGNELVDPPDSKRMGRLPSASSLPSSFDISKYYVSKTHASVKTLPSEIKIQIQTPHQPEPVESDNPVHYTSMKKRTSKEAVYPSVDVNVGEVDSLMLAYLSGELEDHLKLCIRDYKLIHSLPSKLKPFALMDGRDLATFFHTVIAGKTSPDRGGLMEELHHVLWTNVVPYSNPKMEIPTLVMLSTRGIYFVSDSSHKSESSSRPPWMTHARHQSDSAFAWKTDVGKDGSDRSVHKIKKRGTIKPYCVLKYSDLQQVNVGLFDQCIRLTGQDAQTVFTLAIRESVATGNFLQSMTGILSLLATSPMIDKDKQDLEQDFYKAFTKRTKSTIEGLEYIHPSQVRFCYPGEDAIEDILYLVKEKVHGSLPNNSKLTLWMYILGYVVPEEFLTGSTDRILTRTIILSSTHICLAEEDIVTYPLPDFVRGLPENPQHLIVESRKIENLKRVVLYSNYLNVIQLIFSDEKEELVVDASLDYFSEESIIKGREPRPEFCVRLFIQSPSEKEKFLQLLKKHWKELNPEVGRILDIITE
ncbi:uncharacterized protein LOC124288585 [Haliotis rubra]|uniref:uncharacterized protein LOC124288585 n=1 Tax=Haliotis rubra TaxID=36100 RepID=UPI001EE54911|nr:uncharacterized protein LOC124288585 [Haliotis rubra]